jgi:hypothetical protein
MNIFKWLFNPEWFTFYAGGGGGGQPTSTTQTTTTIPEYARPTVERMMGRAEAFSETPYQPYKQQRIAGFEPLQQKSFESAANLGPTAQTGMASQLAAGAGLRAAGIGYDPTGFSNVYQAPGQYQPGQFGIMGARTSSFTRPGTAEAFMSPYQQAVTDIEKREAMRQSDIMGQKLQAQAVQQGAFGGSRQGLVEAERQRNLGMQLGDIQARGGQAAFDRATQQFNAEQAARLQAQLANQQAFMEAQRGTEQSRQFGFGQGMTAAEAQARYGTEAQRMAEQSRQFGAGFGLQGLQQQLAAAGQLGALGQQQFGQEEAAMRAQSAAGAQQQQLNQQKLTQAYQDFLAQRGYEQQQLSFLSDILRGVPLSQVSYQQYQAPPPMASQVAQLGLGAYGISQLGKGNFFKEGGIVKGYAEGGVPEGGIADAAPQPQGSVPNTMDINKLRAALDDMSDAQLETIKENTRDGTVFAMVQAQQANNARLRNANILAESIPESTIKDEMIAADSGIAAAPLPETMFGDTAVGEREETPEMARGGIVAFAKGNKVEAKPDDIANLRALDPLKAFRTETERAKDIEASLAEQERFLGPDKSIELSEKLAKSSEISPESEAMSKAGMAFEAMEAFGQSVPFATAFGKAGAIVGRNVKELDKLKRDAKREADKLRIETARYERLDKRGKYAEAQKSADRIAGIQQNMYALDAAKTEKLANIQQEDKKLAQQLQIAREGFAVQRAGQTDFNRQVLQNKIDESVALFTSKNGRAPNQQELAQIRGAASESAAKLLKVDPYGAGKLNVAVENAVSTRLGKDRVYNDLSLALLTADPKDKPRIQAQMEAYEAKIRAEVQAGTGTAQPGAGTSASAAGSTKPQPGQIFTDASGNRAKYIGGDPTDPKSYQPV